MRRKYVATALVVLTAGLTATAALRRRAARRLTSATSAPATAAAAPAVPALSPDRDAVVLTFAPRPVPVAERPAAPARCGDNGGRTKSGAPCGARATIGGRCHHHRVAA